MITKYKVEKSEYPEGNKTQLVVMYKTSEHGYNIQRVFKGTYKECIEKSKELKEKNLKE